MPRSLLLEGILIEEAEAARAQVWAFDHATVSVEIGRRFLQVADRASQKLPLIGHFAGLPQGAFSKRVPSDPNRHARDDDLILPIGPVEWRAAKLGRILSHFNLGFRSIPSEAELLDLCLRAETHAVELLTRLEGPGHTKKGLQPFVGNSVLDLSRYVLRRMFDELDAGFSSKPAKEQERIAGDIAQRLADLPENLQEQIRREAGLADLSTAALKRTGAIAAVGSALIGTVGVAGFAAYTTVTSVIAAAAGVVGLTLPFTVYLHATAALAFLSNPWVMALAFAGGGHFVVKRANQQMRGRLVPVMVATAVMATVAGETDNRRVATLSELLSKYYKLRSTDDRKAYTEISNTFPCFPKILHTEHDRS